MSWISSGGPQPEPPIQGDPARGRGPYPRGHEGDREQSGLFLALNTSKRGVTIDLSHPDGRALLDRLAAHADVLIHNYIPARATSLGLDYERISKINGRLVVTQITTYGTSGPKSDWLAHNLNSVAAGGWLYMSPGYSKNFELPPLKTFGQQGDFQGGAHGAVATMGALAVCSPWKSTCTLCPGFNVSPHSQKVASELSKASCTPHGYGWAVSRHSAARVNSRSPS